MAIRKVIISLLIILSVIIAGYYSYLLASPEVLVKNKSQVTVNSIEIELPANKIVFGDLQPNTESTIYYTVAQQDGHYRYTVKFQSGKEIAGSCGYVTNSEYRKRLEFSVLDGDKISCEETNKIF